MKTSKAKTIDLLKELKSVCDDAGIRYFLSGELVLYESQKRKVREEFNNGTIAVFAADIDKLCKILEKKAARKVESLANNSAFPGFYLRYMDTSTTLINYSEIANTYETNSMGVNIEIICGCPKQTLKGKILTKLRNMYVSENMMFYARPVGFKRNLEQSLFALFFKIAKHTSLMNKLFRAWVRRGKAKTKKVEIASTRGFIIKYDAELFRSRAKTAHIKEEFDVVEDIYEYTVKYFAEGRNKIRPSRFDIYDFDVPWEDFAGTLKNNNISLTKLQQDEQYFLDWRGRVYQPCRMKKIKNYSYMFCAEDRMLMYKEFKGEKKAQVLAAYENKDYRQLRGLLSGYIGKINEYYATDVGFCSDPDIFEIALRVMLNTGYRRARGPEDYEAVSKKVVNVIHKTNYMHFDSVEKVFWGERTDEKILKAKKEQILRNIKKEARTYSSKFNK